MGNLIYYVMNGKQYVRRVAIPGKKRKREKEGIHPKQQEQMTRFRRVQSYYTIFRKQVGDAVWRSAAREAGSRAHNLFMRVNSPCFDGQGVLLDFKTFRFSAGVLQVPREVRVWREGEVYRVAWEEEREGQRVSGNDRLWVGVIFDARPGAPQLAQEAGGKRRELEGWFRLKEGAEGVKHVYCFFGREDGSAFSESLYFRLEE